MPDKECVGQFVYYIPSFGKILCNQYRYKCIKEKKKSLVWRILHIKIWEYFGKRKILKAGNKGTPSFGNQEEMLT